MCILLKKMCSAALNVHVHVIENCIEVNNAQKIIPNLTFNLHLIDQAAAKGIILDIYTFIFPLFYKREYTCMCYINNYQTIIIHLYNNHKHNRSRCRVVLSLTTPCLHRTLHLVQYYNYIRVHLQVSWKDCTIYKHIP